jgi:riboflavin kinase/FMN adenylyltransferase
MRIAYDYREMGSPPGPGRVVTVGNFDGVHLGHRAVLATARELAQRRGLDLAVLTFEPSPVAFLRPEAAPRRLTDPDQKHELLAEAGADLVLAQRFDAEFAALEPGEFSRLVLAGALAARIVIVGRNFRFGRGRAGTADSLRTLGASVGFEVEARKLISGDGECISSSRIRELVAAGDVAGAARLLGRPHEIEGEVVHGAGDGRRLGFPTANLDGLRTLAPGPGIYAARWSAAGEGGGAAVYIGDRPTLGHGPSVEAHLLDREGDLYGRRLRLRFLERLRGDRRFPDRETLAAQLGRDVEAARVVLAGADD